MTSDIKLNGDLVTVEGTSSELLQALVKEKYIVKRFVICVCCMCVVCIFWLVSGSIAFAQEIPPEDKVPEKAEAPSSVQEDLTPKNVEQPRVEQVLPNVLMPGEEDLLSKLEIARKAGDIETAGAIQAELDELSDIVQAGLAEDTDETLALMGLWADDVRINRPSLDVREPSMVITPDGVIYVVLENRTNNNVGIERSTDGGQTWTHWAWMTSGNATRHPSVAYAEKSSTEKFLYVAVEGNTSSSKSVTVFRWNVVNGTWAARHIASNSLSDDIYPEISTDFPDYTSAHYVYVTYAVKAIDFYPVFFSRSTDYADTWSTPADITDGSENTSRPARPDIGYDSFTNDLYIAFEKPGWNGSTWEQHIWVTQSTNFGSSWSSPIQLSTFPGRSYHPRVSTAPRNSSVLVAYTRDYRDSGDLDIYYAYTTNGGTSWTKNIGLSNSSSTDEQGVELSHSQDNFHAAYVRYPEHDIRYHQTATRSPSAWTSAVTINEGLRASVGYPKPALSTEPTMPADQEAAIAWTDYRDTYYDVFFDSARNVEPPVTHQLGISRFTTSALTDVQTDTILQDATNILQTNDGPGDVTCDVTLSRDRNVTVFATGDGSIDSQAEFNAVIGLPGYVKVVNQINWCDGLIPNVIGCAPVPGNSLVVVRYTPALEGILWAHEYGHTKGLSHRNDVSVIMNGTIAATRTMVNAAECTAFRN